MTDAEIVTAIGIAVHGPHWLAVMPARVGVSRSYLKAIGSGRRPMTRQVRDRLIDYCRSEPSRVYSDAGHAARVLLSALDRFQGDSVAGARH